MTLQDRVRAGFQPGLLNVAAMRRAGAYGLVPPAMQGRVVQWTGNMPWQGKDMPLVINLMGGKTWGQAYEQGHHYKDLLILGKDLTKRVQKAAIDEGQWLEVWTLDDLVEAITPRVQVLRAGGYPPVRGV